MICILDVSPLVGTSVTTVVIVVVCSSACTLGDDVVTTVDRSCSSVIGCDVSTGCVVCVLTVVVSVVVVSIVIVRKINTI